ncbi:MAG: pentapeptide repeat-containing protein [Armatimonadota bacterium]
MNTVTAYRIRTLGSRDPSELGTTYRLDLPARDPQRPCQVEPVLVWLAPGVRVDWSTTTERRLYLRNEPEGLTVLDAMARGWASLLPQPAGQGFQLGERASFRMELSPESREALARLITGQSGDGPRESVEIYHKETGELLFSVKASRLAGANLRGESLAGADFRGADLTDSLLTEAKLNGAALEKATLFQAALDEADLSGADLRHADIQGASLRRACLVRANLTGVDLRGAILSGADLRGAVLVGSNLRGIHLQDAIYDGTTEWPAGYVPEARGCRLVQAAPAQ